MNEVLLTAPNPAGMGRPIITDEQFALWLDDMRVFLRRGCSIRYAMEKCGLMGHETVIREKYRSGDWFSRRIDAWRATLGEMTNDVVFTVVERAKNRLVESETAQLTDNEVKVIKIVAERHRTAQPFFVNRTETAEADDSKLGKVLDTLEATDYDQLGREAEKQVLAIDPPVQNQEQTGPAGDVQAQPDAAATPSGGQGA